MERIKQALDNLNRADKRAGCLAGVIWLIVFTLPVMAFTNWEHNSFGWYLTLFLNMASPLLFPILAIVLLRRATKFGAGLLLVSVIALMIFVGISWLLFADNIVRQEFAESLATELIGAVFTAISIIVIEQSIRKFVD